MEVQSGQRVAIVVRRIQENTVRPAKTSTSQLGS
jgi:hypothetical protein